MLTVYGFGRCGWVDLCAVSLCVCGCSGVWFGFGGVLGVFGILFCSLILRCWWFWVLAWVSVSGRVVVVAFFCVLVW